MTSHDTIYSGLLESNQVNKVDPSRSESIKLDPSRSETIRARFCSDRLLDDRLIDDWIWCGLAQFAKKVIQIA